MSNPKQFDIYWVSLDPTRGVETRKTRPCVILTANIFNRGRLIYVCPFLKGHRDRPYTINVKANAQNGLDQDRRIDLRQLKAIDKIERLKNHMGSLEAGYHAQVYERLKLLMNLP